MANLADVDFVYITKKSHENEELRYSLRSLKHIPHGRVVLAGFKPNWTHNVTHLPTRQLEHKKYENGWSAYMALLRDDTLTDDVVLMNDDFFIVSEVERLPIVHQGPLSNRVAEWQNKHSKPYPMGGIVTANLLEEWGYTNLKCYELHVPFLVNRQKMLAVLEQYRSATSVLPAHRRTLYGNVYGIGGEKTEDCKVFRIDYTPDESATFLSTTDNSFTRGIVGWTIRDKFTERCEYERF